VLHRAEERHLIAPSASWRRDDSETSESLSGHERLTGEEERPECERLAARAQQAEIDREMAPSERAILRQLTEQGRTGSGYRDFPGFQPRWLAIARKH
jgi:hypothetical protein